jgi:hypothetical protein
MARKNVSIASIIYVINLTFTIHKNSVQLESTGPLNVGIGSQSRMLMNGHVRTRVLTTGSVGRGCPGGARDD